MTQVENALMWLYVKTWGLQGQHVIDRNELWNFGCEDLETALIRMAYPRQQKTCARKGDEENDEDLTNSLRKMIMGKFDGQTDRFYKWSQTIHDEVV